MTTLIGNAPNQIPTNADLGGMAYQDPDYVQIGGGNVRLDTLYVGNTTYSGAGARITGDFTNATVASRLSFVTSVANSTTGIYALPSGSSTSASWQATNNSDPTNASKILIAAGASDVQLVSGKNGSGTYLPLGIWNGGAEQLRLDSGGNLYVNNGNLTANVSVVTGNVFIANAQYGANEAMPKSYTDVFSVVFGS